MATLRSLTIVDWAGSTTMLSGMIGFALKAVPFLSIVLGFTFIYKLMPHTRVRFRSAAIAGCAAGLAWYVAQWAFIEFQIGVSSNNALYGALAALRDVLGPVAWSAYTRHDLGEVQLVTGRPHAYGGATLEPEDGATHALPNVFQPLSFRWTLPELEVAWARAYVFDGAGGDVWISAKEPVSETAWNGLGNAGDWDGVPVPAGIYSWRIKIELTDGQECRLEYRTLVLQ